MSDKGFSPLCATFRAGKSLTGSSEDGRSLSLVELSGQRVRNRAAAVSALFGASVTAVVCKCVCFWCLQLQGDSQELGGAPGEAVRWLKDCKICFIMKGFFFKADFEHLDYILSPKT